jgi:hypothetical protein
MQIIPGSFQDPGYFFYLQFSNFCSRDIEKTSEDINQTEYIYENRSKYKISQKFAILMLMAMMQIRQMRMGMFNRIMFVFVSMTVNRCRFLMRVVMVSIVMVVLMGMRQ